jgi:UDP-N-acetylglucosamine 2-epimerase
MFASLAFFVKQIPIIQLASGDLSSEISLVDDFYRHLLTIISSKQISFSKTSLNKTNDILTTLNIKPNSIFYPNPTLDRLNLKNLINKIDEKYDLILMHPQSLSFKDTIDDKNELLELINFNKKNIIIRGNKDKNYEIYYDLWNNLSAYENIEVYDNLEKQKFISLLKFADRFITNSSCSFYEAPLFLNNDQIIRIGRRNKNREIVKYNKDELNSAKKIVDFILK